MEGISDKEIEMWSTYIKEGKTISQIAKENNRAFSVVAKALREKGKRKYSRLKESEREGILELYKLGKSITFIANQFNRDPTTIYYIVGKFSRNKRKIDISEFKNNLKKISQFDIGYVVGLIEGEANVGIIKEKSENKIRYRGVIAISNCAKDMIIYFKDLIKANVHKNRIHKNRAYEVNHPKHPTWKPIYEWKLCDKILLYELCSFLEPYMLSKKKEITILKEFCIEKDEVKKEKLYINMKVEKAKKNSKIKVLK